MKFKVTKMDTGFSKLKSRAKALSGSKVIVGITPKSPKDQFRRGRNQLFWGKTGELLLRPIKRFEPTLGSLVGKVGAESVIGGGDPSKGLRNLGQMVQEHMRAQTDPAPQLKQAIIVDVRAKNE